MSTKAYWEGYREEGEDINYFDEVFELLDYLSHEREEWDERAEESSKIDDASWIRVITECLNLMGELKGEKLGLTENEVFAMFCQIC